MEFNHTHQNHEPHHHDDQGVMVIVVPFPAQSHLNQLLQLSCLISTTTSSKSIISVHYAGSSTHVHQAKLRFSDKDLLKYSQIHFHELPTPPFPSPPPNPNSSTKFPSHLQPSLDASVNLREPTIALLRELSPKARRIVVVHDVLMSFVVQDISSLPNAESYAFSPCSAFNNYFGLEFERDRGLNLPIDVPEGLPSMEGCFTPEILKLIFLNAEFLKTSSGFIYNTCRAMEGTFLDLLANDETDGKKPAWAIGPLNLTLQQSKRESKNRHECLEWLDKQAPNSVLYVSFGTTTSLSGEQIKELAIGLEQSKQKFIWVFREADIGNIFEGEELKRSQLPDGYEERLKEVGIVVTDWAPQLEILGHQSTGGFMSHCGWNSVAESVSNGVPIIAWPMHSDQPKNAFFVTDVLRIGLPVFKWEDREKMVSSSRIEEVVKRLMGSEEGEEMRKRAEELGGEVHQAAKEGGVSLLELDSFLAHITR